MVKVKALAMIQNLPDDVTTGNDLLNIENFIARDSFLHAITFVDRVVEFTEPLLTTPRIGRTVPEFNYHA